HLHQFTLGRQVFGVPEHEDDFWGDMEDEKKFTLSQLLTTEKAALKYEYDYGDSWEHKIVLEKILPYDPATRVPLCIKGKRACPPEDCGGIWGYEQLLEAYNDPTDPEHESTVEYVGKDFDAEYFNLDEINARLGR
ncbi:MAG: plasmid pRiA4b ORF-3 family protein, partial [Desulfobacterales bacterium]